jgi:hypothetical protein
MRGHRTEQQISARAALEAMLGIGTLMLIYFPQPPCSPFVTIGL